MIFVHPSHSDKNPATKKMSMVRFLAEWYAVPDSPCSTFFFSHVPLDHLTHKADAMVAFERLMMYNPVFYYIIYFADTRGAFGGLHIDQRRAIVAMRRVWHEGGMTYAQWCAEVSRVIERVYVFRTLEDLSDTLQSSASVSLSPKVSAPGVLME